jgi:hypothetical protein
MLLRLYNDDSPLIGLPNDKTDDAAKGSAPNLKDGSAGAEDNRALNGTGVVNDGRRDNTSSEQGGD